MGVSARAWGRGSGIGEERAMKRERAERPGEGAAGECATAAEPLVWNRCCAVLCSGLRVERIDCRGQSVSFPM
jgi:hypothetical protein